MIFIILGSCYCGEDNYCMCTPSLAIDAIIEIHHKNKLSVKGKDRTMPTEINKFDTRDKIKYTPERGGGFMTHDMGVSSGGAPPISTASMGATIDRSSEKKKINKKNRYLLDTIGDRMHDHMRLNIIDNAESSHFVSTNQTRDLGSDRTYRTNYKNVRAKDSTEDNNENEGDTVQNLRKNEKKDEDNIRNEYRHENRNNNNNNNNNKYDNKNDDIDISLVLVYRGVPPAGYAIPGGKKHMKKRRFFHDKIHHYDWNSQYNIGYLSSTDWSNDNYRYCS